MSDYVCKSPVLVCGFNRPDLLKNCLEHVRAVNPPRLYISINGPRIGYVEDVKLQSSCQQVALAERTRNPSKVVVKTYEHNLGLSLGIETAVSWALQKENQIIVLADDEEASPTFFQFCDETLDLYQDDLRIGTISGFVPKLRIEPKKPHSEISTLFFCYGWAIWKNRWQEYIRNREQALQSDLTLPVFDDNLVTRQYHRYLRYKQSLLRLHELDAWDIHLLLTWLFLNRLTILPSIPLVKNVGFGISASNTILQPSYVQDVARINQISTDKIFLVAAPDEDYVKIVFGIMRYGTLISWARLFISYWIHQSPSRKELLRSSKILLSKITTSEWGWWRRLRREG